EKLERAGIRAAVRAGRVRASFHLYTTDADVDLALDALTG
ncbi:aminotransferase, partial [Micromonospora sp. DH15]|nr:aminotransferase [Micromonospora sp. DH15]